MQNSITIWNKNHKNLKFWSKFGRFQDVVVHLLVFACIFWFWRVFLLILIRCLQRFKIIRHRHAQKGHRPKFQIFFRNFQILLWFCYEHHENQNQECTVYFQKKSIYGSYPAHHEWQDSLTIHWYSTGPTIYNWNTMFQYWDTMGLRSGFSSRFCIILARILQDNHSSSTTLAR